MENVLVNWNDSRGSKWAPKVFSDGEAGQKEYLAALSKDVLGALKAMDLPGWAQSTLDALGDAPALDALAKAHSKALHQERVKRDSRRAKNRRNAVKRRMAQEQGNVPSQSEAG